MPATNSDNTTTSTHHATEPEAASASMSEPTASPESSQTAATEAAGMPESHSQESRNSDESSASDTQGKADELQEVECPFCKYMRSGGCAAEFDAFMDCGEKAEKGEVEYSDCLKQFENMKLCMEANRQNYLEVLERVDEVKQEHDSKAEQEQATAEEAGSEDESTS